MFNDFEIRQIPLSLKSAQDKVANFLKTMNLRFDNDFDYFAGVFNEDDQLLACGGYKDNILKCLAVDEQYRNYGFMAKIVSHLMSELQNSGQDSLRVLTKPSNLTTFNSLGFKLVGESDKMIMLENGTDFSTYMKYLKQMRRPGFSGIIVMNANPFTLGHRYLIEQALNRVERLYIILLDKDGYFSFSERLLMLLNGVKGLDRITIIQGGDYVISPYTLPSYFIKDLNEVAPAQMALDLNIFGNHIAKTLKAKIRFVGSEPTDEFTRHYNEMMKRTLPNFGVKVVEIERKSTEDGTPISASIVRKAIDEGSLAQAMKMIPKANLPYILSRLAARALKLELDTTPKPGLIDKDNNGAHSDMDYAIMLKGIYAVVNSFEQSFNEFSPSKSLSNSLLTRIGTDAEKAMLEATGGKNTHKGAIFALGLAIVAAIKNHNDLTAETIQKTIKAAAETITSSTDTHGGVAKQQFGLKSALDMARDGYSELFNSWLPFMNSHADDQFCYHKTLLLIMSTLDDTNIVHRAGIEQAVYCKQQAADILNDFGIGRLTQFDQYCIKNDISPGGCADMLALTIFIKSIIN